MKNEMQKIKRRWNEKPLIRYLAGGAIWGFLKNRGVWEKGKVKYFGRIPKDGTKNASASEIAVEWIAEGSEG